MAASLLAGLLLCVRPLSAAVLAVYLVSASVRRSEVNGDFLKRGLALVVGFIPGALAFLGYNQVMTGDALLSPHQVALPDETIGPGWHVPYNVLINLSGLAIDLLGVPLLSLAPVCVYLAKVGWRREWEAWVFLALYAVAYGMYPYHGLSYGPRFLFELAPLLFIISARGLVIACRPGSNGGSKVPGCFMVIVLISFLGVMPERLEVYSRRAAYYDLKVEMGQFQERAVVFVAGEQRERLFPYLAGFQRNDPWLQSKVIYARDRGAGNKELIEAMPSRVPYLLSLDNGVLTRLRGN